MNASLTSVGIIGYGSFGSLLHKLLRDHAPSIEVRVYSKDKKPDGNTFVTFADAAKCDVVILAVPIHAFEEVLKTTLRHARKDSIIVDVATVKMHTGSVLKKLARGRHYIATHPVWGPESYRKRGGNVSGFKIVVTAHTLPKAEYESLCEALASLGFDIVNMPAEEHDKHLAETLFLTHFVGQTILRAGFGRTEADTVSFGYLMDAVESIRHDEALFKDVFRFNPHCVGVLMRFTRAEGEVRALLKTSESETARGMIIGVSGAKGSFSEEAGRVYAKKYLRTAKHSLRYLISAENTLAALEAGEIDLAVFPIQNSTMGVVDEVVHAMAKHPFKVKRIFSIDIKQNLIVRKGVTAKDIRMIVSQDPALKQCTAYLKKEWGKTKLGTYSDTAKAAEDLARGVLPKTTAVIASAAAARTYKLKILAAAIQDLKANATTFIAAERVR